MSLEIEVSLREEINCENCWLFFSDSGCKLLKQGMRKLNLFGKNECMNKSRFRLLSNHKEIIKATNGAVYISLKLNRAS